MQPSVDRDARWRLRLAAALSLGLLASACTHVYDDRRDTVSLHAGDAIAANKVAQMIDPWPDYAANRNIASDGQRAQRAIERYRTNRITPLATTSTSSAPYATPAAAPTPAAPATTQ
ncbi:MAG: pilus assembly protein [Variibacter sp.]|nr:pilus assembly protein [Variibacter sp.]